MTYRMLVWFKDMEQVDPIMETVFNLDETLDMETLRGIRSNLKVAFELMYNEEIIVLIEEELF